MREPLLYNEKQSEVAFSTKSTYKVLRTYGVTVKTMHSTVSLLVTDADINLAHPSLIPTGRKHLVRLRDPSRLRTTTRQPLHSDRLIHIHLKNLLSNLHERQYISVLSR